MFLAWNYRLTFLSGLAKLLMYEYYERKPANVTSYSSHPTMPRRFRLPMVNVDDMEPKEDPSDYSESIPWYADKFRRIPNGIHVLTTLYIITGGLRGIHGQLLDSWNIRRKLACLPHNGKTDQNKEKRNLRRKRISISTLRESMA